MYLNIEGAFYATLRAEIYAGRLRSIFKCFSAKCASAMNTYMNMDKGVAGFIEVNRHCISSLFAPLDSDTCS